MISVITEGLFPDGTPGWFSAGSPDPRVSPAAALDHVRAQADEALNVLTPLVCPAPPKPEHTWEEEEPVDKSWASDLVKACISEEIRQTVCSPDSDTSIVVPTDGVCKIKVEVRTQGHLLGVKKFYVPKKAKAGQLATAVVLAFPECLRDGDGVLFKNLNGRTVEPDVVLFQSIPDVTKLEYRVEWKLLLSRVGFNVLAQCFDVPESLDKGLGSPLNSSGANGVVQFHLVIGAQRMISQDVVVLPDAVVGDLRKSVAAAFKGVLDEVGVTIKSTLDGEELDPLTRICLIHPQPPCLFFHVLLETLVLRKVKEKVLEAFPTLVLPEPPVMVKQEPMETSIFPQTVLLLGFSMLS